MEVSLNEAARVHVNPKDVAYYSKGLSSEDRQRLRTKAVKGLIDSRPGEHITIRDFNAVTRHKTEAEVSGFIQQLVKIGVLKLHNGPARIQKSYYTTTDRDYELRTAYSNVRDGDLNTRMQKVIAYIQSKPYGTPILLRQLSQVTGYKSLSATSKILQKMIEEGKMSRHEIAPNRFFYTVNGEVKTTNDWQPSQDEVDGIDESEESTQPLDNFESHTAPKAPSYLKRKTMWERELAKSYIRKQPTGVNLPRILIGAAIGSKSPNKLIHGMVADGTLIQHKVPTGGYWYEVAEDNADATEQSEPDEATVMIDDSPSQPEEPSFTDLPNVDTAESSVTDLKNKAMQFSWDNPEQSNDLRAFITWMLNNQA